MEDLFSSLEQPIIVDAGYVPTPGDPNYMPPQPDGVYPSKAQLKLNMNAFDQYQLEEMARNYKLTPATLAYHMENLRVPEDSPLRWFPAPFLLQISIKIALGVARGNARICISAPPRHGKSRISTIHGPLWILENFPTKNVVVTTYGADLSEDFSRQIRDFVMQNPDQLELRLRDDANRVSKFITTKGGAMTAIGLGGPITGRGADVLIIDDYIKQIKEALSPTYRQYVWDWFTTTAMTRLEPNASVIVIATRWHHDDLIGRIKKNFPGDWEHISYHAVARENDPLNRQPGEALFPQRYSVKTLMERKALLGTVYYDAIFDQEPHESDSDLTDKTWIIKKSASEIKERPYKFVRVWDFAGTETAKSDWTAGGLYLGDMETKEMGILNMLRKQISAAKVEDLVKKTAENDGPNVEIVICQETGSAGKAVVSFYQTNILKGYKVEGAYWNTGKVIVAQPFLAAAEHGRVWALDAPWLEDFLTEFETFPAEGSGYHDDQIDTAANAYIKLFGRQSLGLTFGRHKQSAQDLVNNLPKDPVEAAKILSEKGVNSPHLLLKQGKSYAFGTVSGATFGRNRSQPRQPRFRN